MLTWLIEEVIVAVIMWWWIEIRREK